MLSVEQRRQLVFLLDVETYNEEQLESIYNNLVKVRLFDESFGKNEPWEVQDLDHVLQKHLRASLRLKDNGFIDLVDNLSPGQLLNYAARLNVARQLGFDMPQWFLHDLESFEQRNAEIRLKLMELGVEISPGTATTPHAELEILLAKALEMIENGFPVPKDIDELRSFNIPQPQAPLATSSRSIIDYSQFDEPTLNLNVIQNVDANIQNVHAGFVMQFEYPFDGLSFGRPNISQLIQSIVNTTHQHLFHNLKYRFYSKLQLDVELINVETGEYLRQLFSLPKESVWGFVFRKDVENYSKLTGAVLTQLFDQPLPSTKWHFHKLHQLTIKVARRKFGGCKNYVTTFKTKAKCCLNPDGQDDLCFWRCLAIALNEKEIPQITKPHSKAQRLKAIEIRDKYYNIICEESTDLVCLDQIEDIAIKLCVHLQINTLVMDENGLTKRDILLDVNAHPNYPTIILHYDQAQNHFLKIQSFRGYGDVLACPYCGRIFDKSNVTQYNSHEVMHMEEDYKRNAQMSHLRVFQKKPITHKQSQFEHAFKKPLVPPIFLAYDFEAYLKPCGDNSLNTSSRQLTQHHVAIAVVVKGHTAPGFNYQFPPVLHVGHDCAKKMMDCLVQHQKHITEALKEHMFRQYKVEWRALEKEYRDKGLCLCDGFNKHEGKCLFHMKKIQILMEYCSIPIVGFNSGKYDMTFATQCMTHNEMSLRDIITKCKGFMKLRYGDYVFLDVHNFVPPNCTLEMFGKMWGATDCKGIFPYDWFDSAEKLHHPSLPPIDAFFNKMKNKVCNVKEYEHAVQVWQQQGFTTFKDYMLYYCERDVDVLIDALNNFRSTWITEATIDPLNYVSISSLAYQNALKNYITHPLYTIESEEVYHMIEMAMYGGNCQVFDHYANDGFLFSLDENNLYGWALMKPLPFGDFHYSTSGLDALLTRFTSVSQIEATKAYEDRYSTKYIHDEAMPNDPYHFTGLIRCAIDYTPSQKERLKGFPPLPNKIKPQDHFNRSAYMKDVANTLNIKESPSEKLIYGLYPLPDYCISSEMLKYLLENDMCILEKIHSVVAMPLGHVFTSYVKEMTKKRQDAANLILNGDVEKGSSLKEFAKLNVNSGYGKTIQNDENFNETIITKCAKEFLKKSIGKQIIDYDVFVPASKEHDGLVGVTLKKNEVKVKSPRYIGCFVLWNAKLLMLDFVYNCLLSPSAPHRAHTKILYTDTDSLYIQISGINAPQTYQDFVQEFPSILRQRHFVMDDSDITPGKMKCEKVIKEAVFLRPKCYCIIGDDSKTQAKSKGVSLRQNESVLQMPSYKECLFGNKAFVGKNIQILKTTCTTMDTIEQTKVALTPFDDKRVWHSVHNSDPYGLELAKCVPDHVFDRIVDNCAKRVCIQRDKFEEYLGCSLKDFRTQLEAGLTLELMGGYGCTYHNYGTVWNIDHIVPLGDKDITKTDVLAKLCHHTNLRPLLVVENSRKRDKPLTSQ